ncbi:Cox19 family protein (CHCH motif), partial [Zostera marina]
MTSSSPTPSSVAAEVYSSSYPSASKISDSPCFPQYSASLK